MLIFFMMLISLTQSAKQLSLDEYFDLVVEGTVDISSKTTDDDVSTQF